MVGQLSLRFSAFVILAVLVFLPGCSDKPKKTQWPEVNLEGSRDKVLLKSNYLIKVKDHTVGYVLMDAKHDIKADEVYGIWFMMMQFNRGDDVMPTLMDVHFVESPAGVLKNMSVDSNEGGTTATFAVVADDTLQVRVENAEEVSNAKLPWQSGTLGPLGIELSLLKNIMKPGETRTLSNVEPTSLAVYKQTLIASDYEEIEAFPGQRLLKIRVVSEGQGVSMEGNLWINSEGLMMRATYPQMAMEFVYVEKRTEVTAAHLKVKDSGEKVDFNEVTSVEIDGIYNQEATRQILTLHSTLTDLRDMFPNTLYQSVRKNGKDEVVLEISNDAVNLDLDDEAPAEEYLDSGPLIESDYAPLQAKAEELTKELESDTEKLKAIQNFVYEHMDEKNYSKAMASAVDAFESGEGDCTEHACLLAAMARSAGLPSRLVSGLVAVPDGALTRCYFHMWNEVYLDGRWVSVDTTRPTAKEKWSRYIKIADSSLTNENDQPFLLSGLVLLGDLSVFCQ
ncbi:MAG: hypothetical protein CMJ76_07000 [Planctomycetaceae bacterium]|nr:hypothetical protein [Planctomycetaceae bacterium]|tara:strand:+ start:697 stop:2220 length:1524 start_codon:yes stop_codon:yes gene_type:complete